MMNKVIGAIILTIVFVLFILASGWINNGEFSLLIAVWGVGIFLIGYCASVLSIKLYQRSLNSISLWIIGILFMLASFYTYYIALGQGYDQAYNTAFYAFTSFLIGIMIVGYYFLIHREKISSLKMNRKKPQL